MLYHAHVDTPASEEIKGILDIIMQVESCSKTAAIHITHKRIGVSVPIIWQWLSGRRKPSALYLRIAKQRADENYYSDQASAG